MPNVYLIGAGPGDPGLLTLKAKRVLETCDVLVYDYLANKAFLDYCRPGAEIIYVGKKGGDHTLPQGDINKLLVAKAREGKMVARLKGGDPYVFGRGAEEAEELLADGLTFEVIPGVTSAVAAPAYAGIPITHRKFASSVSFITGHEDPTKDESAHNWPALAQAASTLVFFMGVKNLADISRRLIEGGRDPKTPAALVRWGTTCRHRSMVSTLEDIPAEAKRQGFKAPSLLVVGEVVSLHDTLNWYEKRPLLGKGVVVTRSREQASDLVRLLTDLGACAWEFPTIEVAPLADPAPVREALGRLNCFDWLVFTSVNGVKCFFAEMDAMALDARALGGLKVAAIGPATAQALAERGIRADFVPEKYVAESVVEGLLALQIGGKRVLIPRAAQAREVLPEELARAGAQVEVLPVYETKLAQQDPDEVLAAIEEGEIHFLTFTSSSTVDNFFQVVPAARVAALRDKLTIACIGPVTAATLKKHGFEPDVQPENYTIPALAQSLVRAAAAV
ncbi:Uroporphyrinogen-III C-methyltransferase [Fundidesulfovibrio magnetotacticus]|uniref:uroporphyrinogen-III C-methyltransferase n=1 Tax=Fundidesulfovibrio magnetotacticus TaxID=2730080 RepID=A0A6V8M010_9BACT|nr:uroporphyrinogen-III C-methyltransferase [Fundidesulfovibrio magnetotacticus]GFK93815.1 Uroporphyrinogen-III C-methyltransferase [Fundidesulfovibrio magnetotacticus]